MPHVEDATLTNPIAPSEPHRYLRAKEEEPDLRHCAVPLISTYTPPGYTYVASGERVKKEDDESGQKEEKEYILNRGTRMKKIKKEKMKKEEKIACDANDTLSVESSDRSRSRYQSSESTVRVKAERENDTHRVPLSASSGTISDSDRECSGIPPPGSDSGVEERTEAPATPALYNEDIQSHRCRGRKKRSRTPRRGGISNRREYLSRRDMHPRNEARRDRSLISKKSRRGSTSKSARRVKRKAERDRNTRNEHRRGGAR